jgi:hypothetical protein
MQKVVPKVRESLGVKYEDCCYYDDDDDDVQEEDEEDNNEEEENDEESKGDEKDIEVPIKLIQKGDDGVWQCESGMQALEAEEKLGEDEEGFDIRIGGHGDSSEYEDSMDYDGHSCEGNEEQGVD